MIQNPFANMTPVVKNLVILNVIFFIAAYLLSHAGVFDMDKWFAAYYPNSPTFRFWQIITYMFMHGGLWHILFNMIALVSFGSIIEQTLGSKRFINFYFLCGIGALVCQMAVQAFEVHSITGAIAIANPELDASYFQYGQKAQKLYEIINTPLVGASGAVFGVLIAFGMLFPNLELMIIPIPVPVKAKYLVPGYIVLELVLGLGQFAGDSVAHFAHIGGALVGFIIIKAWGYRSRNNFS
jgi:membrane associated rhomboid family serine protease